jgi:hypothetical protein
VGATALCSCSVHRFAHRPTCLETICIQCRDSALVVVRVSLCPCNVLVLLSSNGKAGLAEETTRACQHMLPLPFA